MKSASARQAFYLWLKQQDEREYVKLSVFRRLP